MNEADTRAELIDGQLAAAGWATGGDVRVLREHLITEGKIGISGRREKAMRADYVLAYKNRKLAVVEAKSDEVEVSEGVMQAKVYAEKMQLPFSFAANGREIYQISHRDGVEGMVDQFPTPDELWRRCMGDPIGDGGDAADDAGEWQGRFDAVPFNDESGDKRLRYYQEIAANRVLSAIAMRRERVLLTLATGTGKTHIAFQIAWKLFKSRWNLQRDGRRSPRILYLTDRNILANQAYLDFSPFGDDAMVRIDPGGISKRGEVPKNGSVFFTIFQTFMSGEGTRGYGERYFAEYEPDFFDLVIIDECHRGGANDQSAWRGILEHFAPAVHLGMTATPKRQDNVDTYDYFGKPVFVYSLKDGMQDGFLTPFKVRRIQTTIDTYLYTPDDEVVDGEVDEGHVYEEEEINRSIVIRARERYRVQLLLRAINQDEKTIVFCANQAHAALVRDLINQEATNKAVDYCVRVTSNDGVQGENYLRLFQDNEKTIPTILTTSQKLSTGVDARNVRNIVLMRPIKSMIEFKQIIGRGTRLYDGKHYFTIIDFVNAFLLFSDPEWDGEPVAPVEEGGDAGGGGGGGAGGDGGGDGGGRKRKKMIVIELSDGKTRELQNMQAVYFYVNGRAVDAKTFLEYLFDVVKLPELLGGEEALRQTWADPRTRAALLKKLEDEGCGREDLQKLQELVSAQNSDLFDVLEYIAYARPFVSREDRVRSIDDEVLEQLPAEQREFISFVLENYIIEGVDELALTQLSALVTARYGSMHEGKRQLGEVDEIQELFIRIQRHLYQDVA